MILRSSICAWRASPTPPRSKGRTSCCGSTLDLGGEQRTVFSGISAAYRPEQLIGRQVVVVANLAPRKMRFGVSQGMVLCASGEQDAGIFLIEPAEGAQARDEGQLGAALARRSRRQYRISSRPVAAPPRCAKCATPCMRPETPR